MIKVTVTTSRTGGRLIDEIDVPISCPYCSHESTEPLTRVKDDPILTCSACSKQFQVQSGGTARQTAYQIAKLDKELDRLFKS